MHVLQLFWSIGTPGPSWIVQSAALLGASSELKLGFEPDDVTTWKGAGRVFHGLESAQLCTGMNKPRLSIAKACAARQKETDAAYKGAMESTAKFITFLQGSVQPRLSLASTEPAQCHGDWPDKGHDR